MKKTGIFLSHISEEGDLAAVLKRHIEHDFLGLVDVFVSSDHQSIRMGQKWLAEVEKHLSSASCMLILCSEQSVKRPWINFEAGAAWLRNIPVVPVCHTGMTPGGLPKPLDMLQAFEAHQVVGLRAMYETIATSIPMHSPSVDMDVMASEIESFEEQYGFLIPVRRALEGLRKVEPLLIKLFAPEIDEEVDVILDVFLWQLDEMRPHFHLLKDRGLIEYDEGGLTLGLPGGTKSKMRLHILQTFRDIAGEFAAVTT